MAINYYDINSMQQPTAFMPWIQYWQSVQQAAKAAGQVPQLATAYANYTKNIQPMGKAAVALPTSPTSTLPAGGIPAPTVTPGGTTTPETALGTTTAAVGQTAAQKLAAFKAQNQAKIAALKNKTATGGGAEPAVTVPGEEQNSVTPPVVPGENPSPPVDNTPTGGAEPRPPQDNTLGQPLRATGTTGMSDQYNNLMANSMQGGARPIPEDQLIQTQYPGWYAWINQNIGNYNDLGKAFSDYKNVAKQEHQARITAKYGDISTGQNLQGSEQQGFQSGFGSQPDMTSLISYLNQIMRQRQQGQQGQGQYGQSGWGQQLQQPTNQYWSQPNWGSYMNQPANPQQPNFWQVYNNPNSNYWESGLNNTGQNINTPYPQQTNSTPYGNYNTQQYSNPYQQQSSTGTDWTSLLNNYMAQQNNQQQSNQNQYSWF